jgi:CRP-like cAMP-binding protein
MIDTQNQEYVNLRTLQTGDHFGEISMIYGCPRTATVTCNDYCTFAVLLQDNFSRLVAENPEFETELKQYVLKKYNDDPVKQWAFETLKTIPFF